MLNIEEIIKKYKGEWLAIEITKEESGQAVEAKLILHTPNKEDLRNEVPLQKGKVLYITYADSTLEDIATYKAKNLAEKGLIRLATGSDVEIDIPPKFSGKPLSEYLKEIRE